MEQTDNKSPKLLIRQAFERGERLTTFTGNQIGHTVDFRKVVSELRDEGFLIKDYWEKASDGRNSRFTITKMQRPKQSEGKITKYSLLWKMKLSKSNRQR